MREVPNGWTRAPLDAVADVLDFEREPINYAERESRIAGKSAADLYPYYGATGQVGFIDSFRSEGQRVLLGEDAAPFLDRIKDKAYLASGRFWVNNHAHILTGAAGLIDNRFLCHQLNTIDYHPFVTGSTRLKLTSSAMRQIPMVIPPATEQTRIVEKLEELLSDLDAGVAELRAAQKKLAQYRQSLLKAAVEGALTSEWREHNTPTETGAQLLERILSERRARWEAQQLAKFKAQGKAPPKDWQAKYPEPVQPDTNGLPALPQGWVWANAEQICGFITKGTTPPKDIDDGNLREIPFLRVTNLTNHGVLDLSDRVFVSRKTHQEYLARSAVFTGDVLMNIVGPPLGQVSIVPSIHAEWNVNQAIAIFRTVSGVSNDYLSRCLLSPEVIRWLKSKAKTTAGQTNLTLEICRALPIPLPPQSEQFEIQQKLDSGLSAIEDQLTAIQISLTQAAAQRQNILRAAFAGELVPQDPNDEPASVLLERIRAERAARAAQGTGTRQNRRTQAAGAAA